MTILDQIPFRLFQNIMICLMMFCTHSLSAQDGEIEAYVKRILDKTYTLENSILSNAQRIDYLHQVLTEDLKELPKSVTPEEKNALKARISKVKKLNQEAIKIKKRATKNVEKIEKLTNSANENTYERADEIKVLVDELSMLFVQINNLAEQSLDLPVAYSTEPYSNPAAEINGEQNTPGEPSDTDKKREVLSANTEAVPTYPTSDEPSMAEQSMPPKKKGYAKYDRKQDVYFNPPVTECNGVISDKDPFTGKNRKLTQPAELFHFTNSFMVHALQGKEHITCYASIIEVQKKTFLHLKFVINDANGARTFGSIRQDVPIIITLINETKIPLTNGLTDPGSMDPSGTVFTVSASTQLWKSEHDALMKMEIDKIRIPWQRGFEEYEVYNVAVIQRLLQCF